MAGPEHAAKEHQQPARRVDTAPRVQARLRVGAVDDPLEREADEVADQLVASIAAERGAPGDAGLARTSRIRRVAAGDAAPIGPDGGGLDRDTESLLSAQLGGGRSLDGATRDMLEPHLGADLSGVRVHDDGVSAELNRRMSAQAFTLGRDIFFSGGAPDASSAAGQGLLAHELAHVVQQGGAAQRRVDPGAAPPSRIRRRAD